MYIKTITKPIEKSVRWIVSRTLMLVNKISVRMTNPDDIKSLAKKLYPVSSDKKLIRLGPKGDGGYLIPNDLTGIEACFSPGVSDVSWFEKDCVDLGIKAFLADKSVSAPSLDHPLFYFTNKFIGARSNDDFITVDSWVEQSIPDSIKDLLIQVDIEGYEYETFLSISDKLMKRFRIIVVEFHNLQQLWNKPYFDLAAPAFEKILQTHTCVHAHPNNNSDTVTNHGITIPKTIEFTFLRNDRISNSSYENIFPNPLDYDNSPQKPPIPLPKFWYKS